MTTRSGSILPRLAEDTVGAYALKRGGIGIGMRLLLQTRAQKIGGDYVGSRAQALDLECQRGGTV